MCLALIAINQHPLFPLIILSNRDEFYNRATIPAHYWPEAPDIFAGKDLAAGGTWLGINKQGAVSLITNYRDPSTYNATLRSRGLLVTNYLLDSLHGPPEIYLNGLKQNASNYNLFNLFVGSVNELAYYSNVENKIKKLTSGLYGISNHLLNTPWYKLLRAKELFQQTINKLQHASDPKLIEEFLFPILADYSLAPNNLLPQTGIFPDLEKQLSSIFVKVPEQGYGTRCSTLILFTHNELFFSEKTFIHGVFHCWSRTHIQHQ